MCLWYCQEGAAGVEFRQLQSSQGIVSAWALAAPELDADETLSPKPSCIGPGAAQSKTSTPSTSPPSPPLFPQQQTPYWTLPLPFTSFRPLELSHPLSPGPHIAILLLYIGGVEYCTQSLFIHSHCTIIDYYSDIVLQVPVHSRAPNFMGCLTPDSWQMTNLWQVVPLYKLRVRLLACLHVYYTRRRQAPWNSSLCPDAHLQVGECRIVVLENRKCE